MATMNREYDTANGIASYLTDLAGFEFEMTALAYFLEKAF